MTNRRAISSRWAAVVQHVDVLVWLCVSLPLLVNAVVRAAGPWLATGDYAHTELAVRDVPSNLPLTGVAGRFGPFDNQHAHPGPAMSYVFTPLYRLLGSGSGALLIATVLVHVAAFGLAVWAARRIGGRAFSVPVALCGALLFRSLGAEFFVTPWNPWMPVVVFFAFVIVCIGVAAGRSVWLWLAVALASYCGQTHISYLVLVCGLLGASSLWLLWQRRSDMASLLRPVAAAVAVGVVLWAPVAYDQLRRTRNFGWLVGRFTHACDPRWWGSECAEPVGPIAAGRALSVEMNVFGGWLRGGVRNPATAGWSILAALSVVALVALCVRVRRRGDALATTALAISVAAIVLGWFSGARILGDFYDYVIRWSWPLAASTIATALFVGWRTTVRHREQFGRARQQVAALSVVVGGACGGWLVADAASSAPPYTADAEIVNAFGRVAEVAVTPDTTYLVRWHDPAGLGGVGFGLVLELDKRGVETRTDWWTRFAVGAHRVAADPAALPTLYVVVGDASIDRFSTQFGLQPIGTFDPRSADETARSEAARAVIEQRLTELGRTELLERIDQQFGNAALIAAGAELPDDVNAAVGEYTELRLPAALFLLPPGAEGFA